MRTIEERFIQQLKNHSLEVSDRQREQFRLYFQQLVEWNEHMNLTSITEMEQVYAKHFFDSLTLAFHTMISETQTLADIGSGAGFPSIPLKIMFPHLQVTIVDSLRKRIGFLEALADKLELVGVNCIHGRAEDEARKATHRDTYDLVTARAVARLNTLSELCLPFVKIGGYFVAMKGTDPAQEIREAEYAFKQLGGVFVSDISFKLPQDHSSRHIIIIEKEKATPKAYPRKAGLPIKMPLVQ